MSDTAYYQPKIHPTIDAILRQCADFLAPQQLASKTVTNYLSDIRLFLEWSVGQHQALVLKDLERDIHAYRAALLDSATPIATINRHLASLRQFGAFLTTVHQIEINTKSLKNISHTPQKHESTISNTNNQAIEQFGLALAERGCSHATIENYLGDVRQFAAFDVETTLFDDRRKDSVGKFVGNLGENSASSSTIRRKKASLKQFYAWAKQSEYIKLNIFESFGDRIVSAAQQFIPLAFFEKKLVDSAVCASALDSKTASTHPLARAYRTYTKWPVSSYLHLALLVLFVSMLGAFGYKQLFLEAGQKYAFPTSLTRPSRVLSFQGRLTDSAGTPITVASNLKFRLFNHITNGTGDAQALWASGTCSITPDQDGIFTSLLGSACGPEIPPEIFSENQNVYLEVQVGSETLTPRQQIATVGYALNAETLQGYPASASAVENTVPVFDNNGDLVIGLPSPEIRSDSGTFSLKGDALTLATNTGTGGNITLAPDGAGQVNLIGGTTTQDFISVTNANLSTGTLVKGTVGNNNTGYKFLSFVGGSVASEKFFVNALGGVYAGNSLSTPVATISATNSSATPLIINGTGGQILSVANNGNILGAGTLTGLTGLTSSGTITFSGLNTAGAVAYTQSGGVVGVTAQGVSGYVLTSGGAGTPAWVDPSTIGTNYWQLNSNVLAPGNVTRDLAVGGTATASALFRVSGLPTSTGNGAVLSSTTLTTGNLLRLSSTATTLTSGKLFSLDWSPGSSTTATGDLFTLNIGANGNVGNLFNITDNTSSLFAVSETGVTSNLPTSFTSPGDVSIAYDLNFTNPTASYIKSVAPLYLQAGETFNSSDLNFTTYNKGNVIANSEAFVTTGAATVSGQLVVGTSTAPANIGALYLTNASTFGKALAILNQTETQDIFTASASGVAKFTIASTGNLTASGTLTGLTGLTSSGTITFSGLNTAGAVAYTQSGGVVGVTAQGVSGYVLTSGGAGTPAWVDPSTIGTNYWQLNNKVLAPGNITYDLALGGNATASALFQVFGNTGNATTSGTLTFNGAAYSNNVIAATKMSGLQIGDSSTGNVIFNQNRNVGIGTTNPGAKLDVSSATGGSSSGIRLIQAAENAAATLSYVPIDFTVPTTGLIGQFLATANNYSNAGINLAANSVGLLAETTNGQLGLGAGGANGFITFNTGGYAVANERMRIDKSGNVGIGTTTPSALLDIAGDASTSASLVFRAASPTIDTLNGGNLSFTFSSGGDGGLTTKFAINANGNLTATGTLTGLMGLTSSGIITLSNLSTGVVYNTSGVLASEAQLSSSRGGTGADLSTAAQGALPYFSATGVMSALAPTTAGYVLQTNGVGTNPSWVSPAGVGTNYWQLNNLALAPGNTTLDIVVGGSATSSAKFQVFGNTGNATTSGTLTFNGAAYSNNVIAATKMSGLQIGDSSTGNVIFNQNGNVGIGTTAPTDSLQTQKDQNSVTRIVVRNDTTGTNAAAQLIAGTGAFTQYGALTQFNNSYTTNGLLVANSVGIWSFGNTNGLRIFTTDARDLTLGTNNAANVTLQSGGNFGINNTSPTYKLDVTGSASISANLMAGGQVQLGRFAANPTTIGAGSVVYNSTDAALYYSNGGSWVQVASGGSTVGGSGTLNYLAKWTSGSALGNSVLYDDGTNIGIGTATPGKLLDVNGLAYFGTANTMTNVLDSASSNSRAIHIGAADSGTTAFGSNVGIILTNTDTTTNNSAQIGFGAKTGVSTASYVTAVISAQFGARTNGTYQHGGILKFATSPTAYNSGPIERMRIDATGVIGINTTTPRTQLDILNTSGTQLRLTYTDNSVYTGLTTDSSGNFTISATGTKIILSPDLQINGGDILGSAGGTRITLIDALRQTLISGDLVVSGSILNGDGFLTVTRTATISSMIATDMPLRLQSNVGADIFSVDNVGNATAGGQVRVGRFSTNPTTLGTGSIAYNTTDSSLYYSNGTTWLQLATGLSGSGTTNYLTKWTSSTALGNSILYDNGTNVGIGDTSPSKLFVVGNGDLFQVDSSGNVKAPTLALGTATIAQTDRLFDANTSTAITNASTFTGVFQRTLTGTLTANATSYGIYNYLTNSASDGQVQHYTRALFSRAYLSAGSTTDVLSGGQFQSYNDSATLSTAGITATSSAALEATALNNAAGTITYQYGLAASSYQNSTGTVSNSYGVNSSSFNNNATGILTNSYGATNTSFTNVNGASITSAFGTYASVYETAAQTTGGITAAYGGYFVAQDATTTYGSWSTAIQNTANTETFTNMYGAINDCQTNSSSVTVSNCYGTYGRVIETAGTVTQGIAGLFESSAAMTTGYGVYANLTGASTTSYGLYSNVTGAGTTNYGLYSNVSGAGTNYAGIFMGGNVGIGTTAPGTALSVNGVISGNTGNLRLQATGTGTGSTGTGSIYFLDSGGNVKGRFETANTDNYGDGADGAVTITATKNINTDLIVGARSYADGIAYRVTPPSDFATSVTRYSGSDTISNGIVAGDEVMIINMQGAYNDSTDVGNYEIMTVSSVSVSSITFSTSITQSYDGNTASNQKVVIQRVPNYTNVTLSSSGKIVASGWDALVTTPTSTAGYYTGIVALKANGTVSIASGTSIDVAGKGYTAVLNGLEGSRGESYNGRYGGGYGATAGTTSSGGGGMAGGTFSPERGGDGGDATLPGVDGDSQLIQGQDGAYGGGGGPGAQNGSGGCGHPIGAAGGGYGTGGSAASAYSRTGGAGGGGKYGSPELTKLFLGSAGGSSQGTAAKNGGNGGGAILILSNTLTLSGAITATGSAGTTSLESCSGISPGGGGGAGGSVLLIGSSVTLGTSLTTATGGAAGGSGSTVGGAAGDGRIRIDYLTTLSGTTSPAAYDTSSAYYGTLYAGSVNTYAADLAEFYVTGDRSIEAGDVVSISDTTIVDSTSEEVVSKGVLRKTQKAYDQKLLGIISTAPGVVLGSIDGGTSKADQRMLALSGRVPVKIDPESESIAVGDFITSSNKPGLAKKATRAGYTVGKALESWSPDGSDRIDVFVSLGYSDPTLAFTNTGEIDLISLVPPVEVASFSGTTYALYDSSGSLIERTGIFSDTITANLRSGIITAEKMLAQTLRLDTLLTSPIAHIDLLTSTTTPSADQSGIAIRLDPTLISFMKTVMDSTVSAVIASIDIQGNATFSGSIDANTISAQSTRTEKLQAAQAELESIKALDAQIGNATISGTLYADSINTQSIFGLDDKISSAVQHAMDSATASSAITYTPPASALELINSLIADTDASTSAYIAMLNSKSGSHVTDTEVITPTAVLINEFLSVQGLANFNYAEFSTGLTVNGSNQTLTVTGNSINLASTVNSNEPSQSTTLYIQPSGSGSLSLLGNRMVLSDSGDISINGNLYVNGSIYTKDIQTETVEIGFTSLLGSTASDSAMYSPEIYDALVNASSSAVLTVGPGTSNRARLLALYNNKGELVSEITASGSATFQDLTTKMITIAAPLTASTSQLTVTDSASASSSATIAGTAQSNASAATAVLPAGDTQLTIANVNVAPNTLIYLTPVSNTENQVLYVSAKNDGQGFTVAINKPVTHDITFNYWLIRVQ